MNNTFNAIAMKTEWIFELVAFDMLGHDFIYLSILNVLRTKCFDKYSVQKCNGCSVEIASEYKIFSFRFFFNFIAVTVENLWNIMDRLVNRTQLQNEYNVNICKFFAMFGFDQRENIH